MTTPSAARIRSSETQSVLEVLLTSSSSSWGVFAMGCGCASRQRGGMAGDIIGCWNTVVTVVEEQREGAAMDVTSMAAPLAPL